jgi:hypothetical protein
MRCAMRFAMRFATAFALAATFTVVLAAAAPPAPTTADGLSFVEGLLNAEDLVHVPQTAWIIASGLEEGVGLQGHIYLVNTANGSSRVLIPGHVAYGPKAAVYGDCPGKPDESRFSAHGLSLSGQTASEQRLLVVHHGERESIEVFRFKAAAKAPALTWIGCVVFPPGVSANGVTALPGGGIAATSFMDTDDPDAFKKLSAGQPTGGVLIWRPRRGWQKLSAAAGISAPNGVEATPDGRQLFVAGWGDQTVTRVSIAGDRSQRDVLRTGFHTDNLRWGSDGFLYAAGQRDNVPDLMACATTSKICSGPFSVLKIDSMTLKTVEVLRHPGDPRFGSASTALKIGGQFWLGTPRGARIAVIAPSAGNAETAPSSRTAPPFRDGQAQEMPPP